MITAAKPVVRDYLSYSAVRTFQSCPLKYRFRYVDRLEEDRVSASLNCAPRSNEDASTVVLSG